jgi:uncharacterized membrane protein YkoI
MDTSLIRSKRVVLPSLAAVAVLGIGGVVWSSAAGADLQGSQRDRVAAAATRAVGGTAVEVESSDDRGEAYEVEVRRADGAEVDVSLDKNLHVVSQEVDHHDAADHDDGDHGHDGDDRALSASERSSAQRAALDAVNGGTVTEVEAGDDGEAYEVKVNKADGTEVKVGLDPHLHVVSKEVDHHDSDHSDHDDRALSASDRTSAERAALGAVHGGTVTDVEAGDDGHAYEVEVRVGTTEWDVALAPDFRVLHKSVDD